MPELRDKQEWGTTRIGIDREVLGPESLRELKGRITSRENKTGRKREGRKKFCTAKVARAACPPPFIKGKKIKNL